MGGLVTTHLASECADQVLAGDLLNLGLALLGQNGAEAEVGWVKVGGMGPNDLLQLARALRGPGDRSRTTAEELDGVSGEGIREGFTGRAGRLSSS